MDVAEEKGEREVAIHHREPVKVIAAVARSPMTARASDPIATFRSPLPGGVFLLFLSSWSLFLYLASGK